MSLRIGVVSDTHNNLKNVRQIVDIFNSAKVEYVIHTGDITKGTTLSLFADLEMQLYGVFGNNDVERESLDEVVRLNGFCFADHSLDLNWENRRIIVVHDPQDLGNLRSDYNLALHGHTHRYRADYSTPQQMIFNPGECAGHMVGYNAVGIVDLNTLVSDLVHF